MNYSRPFRLLIVLVAGAIVGTFLYKFNFDSRPTFIYSVQKSASIIVGGSSSSDTRPKPARPRSNDVIEMRQRQEKPGDPPVGRKEQQNLPLVGAIKSAVETLKTEKTTSLATKTSTAASSTSTTVKDTSRRSTTVKPALTTPSGDADDGLPVPRICHYAWYSTSKLTFRFHHFISLLSAYIHIKPKKIMFWYEIEPRGPWWVEIRKRVPIIEMKYRKAPTEIYGNPIKVPEHQTDIVRLEAIMNYGGIYHDLDVIVVKSFDPLRKYNTTMGYETPGGLCNGIIISAPHAPFLEIWHKTYKSFNDGQWAYHSVQLPARLALEHKSLIHTEQDTLHRPNWIEKDWLYKEGKIWDWSKNYAVHLWFRFHNVDHNPEDIKRLDTTMGQLFRYIYYGRKDLIKD